MPKQWSRATPGQLDMLPGVITEPRQRNRLETIEDLLERSGRAAVPLRTSFAYKRGGLSPLARLVMASDQRALQAYLLIHAVCSSEPWDCCYPSHTWVRTHGLRKNAELTSARAAVSKTHRRLANAKLLAVARRGRLAQLTLLKEDGSGEPYSRPLTRSDPWFSLPYFYWSTNDYQRLALAETAMLLVALSLPPRFYLSFESMKRSYGISGQTARKGMNGLERRGIIRSWQDYRIDPSKPTGWRKDWWFELTGIYSRTSTDTPNLAKPNT